jgi:hypothetical protein
VAIKVVRTVWSFDKLVCQVVTCKISLLKWASYEGTDLDTVPENLCLKKSKIIDNGQKRAHYLLYHDHKHVDLSEGVQL